MPRTFVRKRSLCLYLWEPPLKSRNKKDPISIPLIKLKFQLNELLSSLFFFIRVSMVTPLVILFCRLQIDNYYQSMVMARPFELQLAAKRYPYEILHNSFGSVSNWIEIWFFLFFFFFNLLLEALKGWTNSFHNLVRGGP